MAGAGCARGLHLAMSGMRDSVVTVSAALFLMLCLAAGAFPSLAHADEGGAEQDAQVVEVEDAAGEEEAGRAHASDGGEEAQPQDSSMSASDGSDASSRAQDGLTEILSMNTTSPARTSGLLAERVASLVAGEAIEALAKSVDLALRARQAGSMFAMGASAAYAAEETVEVEDDGVGGLVATSGGTVVGDKLTVTTKGARSPAVAAGGGGGVSLANSTLETAGTGSPLVEAAGAVELGNTAGTAAGAQLAFVEGSGKLLLHDVELSSSWAGSGEGDDSVANGITLYQEAPKSEETRAVDGAVFQAVDSKLSSEAESGALFYLSNTAARVLLFDTQLDFDSSAAKLAVAAADASHDWGTEGANGATAVLTGIEQQLEGDIEVDDLSFLEVFLLRGSTWTGSSKVVKSQKANAQDDLDVNIDASSKWVVTDNSTVTNLNVEPGGKLVDKQGKAVKVADKDGNVLAEGRSELTVTINGNFSTTVVTSAASDLVAPSVDRSAFDGEYGTDTSFGPDAEWLAYSDEAHAMAVRDEVLAWFEARFPSSAVGGSDAGEAFS